MPRGDGGDHVFATRLGPNGMRDRSALIYQGESLQDAQKSVQQGRSERRGEAYASVR
jgi:hypothetical protein